MSLLRSILAVVAGFVFVGVVSTAVDYILCKTIFPELAQPHAPARLLALALAYRVVIGVGGGWITAKLAPGKPMTHALVLGVLGTLAGIAGAVAMWSVGDHWYPIALAAFGVPQSWLGAKLASRKAG